MRLECYLFWWFGVEETVEMAVVEVFQTFKRPHLVIGDYHATILPFLQILRFWLSGP